MVQKMNNDDSINNCCRSDIYPFMKNIYCDDKNYEQYCEYVESRRKKEFAADIDLVKQDSTRIDLDDLKSPSDGRYSISVDGVVFEIFFKQNRSTEKLFVTFDGSRIRGDKLAPLPTFSRWSWYKRMESSVLCFEDPMYYIHPDLKLGWFYGTNDINYRSLIKKILFKFKELLELKNKDITFYSSSGGGNVALYMGVLMPSSNVVAINPQVILKNERNAKSFEKETGISLTNMDKYGRNNVAPLIKNGKLSKFLVIFNMRSKEDFDGQMKDFCQTLEIEPKYGITKKDNVAVWIYDGPGSPTPHVAYDYNTIFHAINYVIKNFDDLEMGALQGFVTFITEMWRDHLTLKAKNYQFLKRMIMEKHN